jgi:hypothetical protein
MERCFLSGLFPALQNKREIFMKKLVIAAAILGMSATASFAQSGANPNAPQPGSTGVGLNQPGTTSTGAAVDRPDSNGGMNNISGMTSGSSGMNNNMRQDGASKDGTGQQNKGGMSK